MLYQVLSILHTGTFPDAHGQPVDIVLPDISVQPPPGKGHGLDFVRVTRRDLLRITSADRVAHDQQLALLQLKLLQYFFPGGYRHLVPAGNLITIIFLRITEILGIGDDFDGENRHAECPRVAPQFDPLLQRLARPGIRRIKHYIMRPGGRFAGTVHRHQTSQLDLRLRLNPGLESELLFQTIDLPLRTPRISILDDDMLLPNNFIFIGI